MIAKEETMKERYVREMRFVYQHTNPLFDSTWLKKTQNGTTRLSIWVWIIGIVLLLVSEPFSIHIAFVS